MTAQANPTDSAFTKRRVPVVVIASMLLSLLLGCFIMSRSYRNPLIPWEEFSATTKAASLAQGDAVVVLAYPLYDPSSRYAWRDLEHRDLARIAGGRRFKAMVLEYADWSKPDVRALFREVGHTKYCFGVVYIPNEPPTRFDPLTLETWPARPYAPHRPRGWFGDD